MPEQTVITNNQFRVELEGISPDLIKSVALPAYKNGSWSDLALTISVESGANVSNILLNMLKNGPPRTIRYSRLNASREPEDQIMIYILEITSYTAGVSSLENNNPSEIRVIFKVEDVIAGK